MKLEMAILAGAETKQFLVVLTEQLDRAEELVTKLEALLQQDTKASAPKKQVEPITPMAPVKKAKAKKAKETSPFEDEETTDTSGAAVAADNDFSFDEEQEESSFSFDEEQEEQQVAPPAPKAKAPPKKVTIEECNAAALTLMKKHNRDYVIDILKKNFNTTSLTKIEEKNYPKLLQLLAV